MLFVYLYNASRGDINKNSSVVKFSLSLTFIDRHRKATNYWNVQCIITGFAALLRNEHILIKSSNKGQDLASTPLLK